MLVHRIAWLLSVENNSPYSIMAVTFTNKAAAEMRHRIGQLMGTSQGGMWVGTFHGLAHRLLRAHHMDANLPQVAISIMAVIFTNKAAAEMRHRGWP